jgi:hypothetical protein
MMTMMMMQRLMCHQTQQQQQQQQTQPSTQQQQQIIQQNPTGTNSTPGSVRSTTPPRLLTFGHHPFHRIHSSDTSPTIDTRVRSIETLESRNRNIDTFRGDSDKIIVDVSAVSMMHQSSGMAASPQPDHSDSEEQLREERTRTRRFRVSKDEEMTGNEVLTEKVETEQDMDMEEDEEDLEMNDRSEEEEEELNVDDEDQEGNDLMSSPVDLTNRHHSNAHLMLTNHRLMKNSSDILDSHSPVICNTNSLSSSPKGDTSGNVLEKTSRTNYRSESVSSVGSGMSLGGNSGGGPSTTTAGSARRNLAFSVENILDPTKFTGRGPVQHSAGRLVAAPRLAAEVGGHVSATACCWRPQLDAASPDRSDDNSGEYQDRTQRYDIIRW